MIVPSKEGAQPGGPRVATSQVRGRHRIPVIGHAGTMQDGMDRVGAGCMRVQQTRDSRAADKACAGLIPRGLRRRLGGGQPALGQAAGPGSSRSHQLITPSRSVPSRNAPGSNRTVAEYLPGPGPRSHPNCPSHLIPVVRLHMQAHDHDVMDPAPVVYQIRIRDHLGATVPRRARWIRRWERATARTNLTVRERTTMTSPASDTPGAPILPVSARRAGMTDVSSPPDAPEPGRPR